MFLSAYVILIQIELNTANAIKQAIVSICPTVLKSLKTTYKNANVNGNIKQSIISEIPIETMLK
jgi:hypothetical protein